MNHVKSVYIADDDQEDRLLIRESLENINREINITEIENGVELLDQLNNTDQENPALIILDMNMPRMSGLETLNKIRSSASLQNVPVIMVSTSSDQLLINLAYDEGISAYITKPVNIHQYKLMAEAIHVCYLNSRPTLVHYSGSGNFKNKSVLIIEDNADHWDLMNYWLSKSTPELKITRVNGKASALNYLTNEYLAMSPSIGLILLDLYLPNRKDGLSLLNSIRYFFLYHNLPLVPIVIFSSSGDQQDIQASYQNYASAYIIKSPDLNQSFSYLKDLCYFWWNIITVQNKEH
ncbi:response regulator [Dyadobacter sp. NIV53]|uniref:response regulator n=1 Tax=Dyadobacter sp. NIV53 TaxID=2861765 RepID=UPI001C8691EC|nr:response regulator [Dyadobacter sp. NIV53]